MAHRRLFQLAKKQNIDADLLGQLCLDDIARQNPDILIINTPRPFVPRRSEELQTVELASAPDLPVVAVDARGSLS